MGTMAPNYANLFMNNFETQLLSEFEGIYHTSPILWYRFIDDIFFIWIGDSESLNKFIYIGKVNNFHV